MRFSYNKGRDNKWIIVDTVHFFPVCETYEEALAKEITDVLNAYGSRVAHVMDMATYGPGG